jgi:hypothetical protein
MAQDAPVLKIEVRDIVGSAPFGPWKKLPGGVWIREQLTTAEELEKLTSPSHSAAFSLSI